MAFGGAVRPVHAIAVQLSRPHFRQIHMPHLVGLFSHPDSFDLLVSVFAVEQTKLYTRRVFRKQREVYTRSVPGGSQRIGIARPYFHQEPRLSRTLFFMLQRSAERCPNFPDSRRNRAYLAQITDHSERNGWSSESCYEKKFDSASNRV